MNRILILGASGFIGNALYKELHHYFDVYGTYCRPNSVFKENQVMYRFDVETDDVKTLLHKIRPNYIISSLRGDFNAQFEKHQDILNYVKTAYKCRLLFLSTVNVFDGKSLFPSFEDEPVLAESDYGKYKIAVEGLLSHIPPNKYAILRLPMVLGVNSPRVIQLKQASKHNATLEVFPNLIISITTANKISQQVHYIINKNKYGIYHLASEDVIHHIDLFKELADRLELNGMMFKQVYSTNDESYFAILSKKNKLPKPYRISVAQVIEECTLKEEIITLKK